MKLRKATAAECAEYLTHDPNTGELRKIPPVYPLGYIGVMKTEDHDFVTVHVEDLRGSWSRPDPVWEIRAPDGYQFDDSCHGHLEQTLDDVRYELTGLLRKCEIGNGCGCEFDSGEMK